MVRLACLLSLCWAAGATAAVRCELAPAQAQSARPDGYGRAALRVEHDLPATVRAVALRAVSGGPWMVVEMVAPTGRTGPKTVRLPATSAAQTYVILGLGSPDDDPRESAPLFQAQAAIAWPPDRVNAAAVLHPSVGGIGGSAAAAWPADLKAQVLIVLATGTVLGLFVLPARQVRLRAMLILAIAAGMGAAVAGLLRVTPTVTGRTMHVIDRYEGRSWMTTLTHLAARRTTTARLTLEGPAWCAYGSAEAMAADGTVLRPTDGSVLADTDVVCPLRPGRPQVLLATGPPPQGAPLPATVTLGQAGAGRTLTSDRDTP
ncbi:MAG: hypothetical protein GX591_14275, partial [Planctomycetes bacterium]|nr:hypothetical protein [Planctomycetota bacterium]